MNYKIDGNSSMKQWVTEYTMNKYIFPYIVFTMKWMNKLLYIFYVVQIYIKSFRLSLKMTYENLNYNLITNNRIKKNNKIKKNFNIYIFI